MKEIWHSVPKYTGCYEVSNLGKIRSLPREVTRKDGRVVKRMGKELRAQTHSHRFKTVGLSLNGKVRWTYVHLLVAEAFLGECPEGCRVRFQDGDTLNVRLDNLFYEEFDSSAVAKLSKDGAHPRSKLTIDMVREIRAVYGSGAATQKELAEHFEVCQHTIRNIVSRRTWKHVD